MSIRPIHAATTTLLCLCLLALFPTGAGAQVTGRLEGVVVDDANNPLPNVEVYLKDVRTNAVTRPAKTNKSGKYLYMTQPGAYFIWPKLEGYMLCRMVIEMTNNVGVVDKVENFFDEKQEFDKVIRIRPPGDIGSSVRNKVDFTMCLPEKHVETVNRLYAEYRAATSAPADKAADEAAAAASAEEKKQKVFEGAVALLEQKDYAGAMPLLKQTIELDPMHTEAYYQLGKAAVELENWAEAEPALKKVKELDPTKPGVSFHLARLYNKTKRNAEAVQALEEEMALSPDMDAVLDSLGGLYMDMGQPEKAAQTFEQLIAKNPEKYDAYVNLAAVYKQMGNRAKEEETYQRLGDKDATGQALYNLGNLAFNRDEKDKAAEYYKLVIQKNPNHAQAHYQLANTLVGLGDFEGAVSHLEDFVKLAPKDPKAAEAKLTADELKKLFAPAGKPTSKAKKG